MYDYQAYAGTIWQEKL